MNSVVLITTPSHIQTDTNRWHFFRARPIARDELELPIYLYEKDSTVCPLHQCARILLLCLRQRMLTSFLISPKTLIFQLQYHRLQLSKAIVTKARFFLPTLHPLLFSLCWFGAQRPEFQRVQYSNVWTHSVFNTRTKPNLLCKIVPLSITIWCRVLGNILVLRIF